MAIVVDFSRSVSVAVMLMALAVVGVRSATTGNVTNFTVNGNSSSYVQIQSGMKLQILCRVMYNTTPPIVHIKKTDFSNHSWPLADNGEYAGDEVIPADWSVVDAAELVTLPPKTLEYIVTIYPTKNSDSGNYSCSVGTVKSRITVDVTTEATAATMTFNGQLLPTGQLQNSVQVTIGQAYSVSCNISGGNPYPTVNISTSKGQLTPTQITTNWTAMSTAVNMGFIRRATNATVQSLVFDASMLGKQVICAGGVNNPAAVSTYFIPISDAVVPQFQCTDKVMYPNKVMDLVISCQVFAPNLTSAYVRWTNSTKNNNTITAVLARSVSFVNDTRYALLVQVTPTATPSKTNYWYTMTLTVSHAHDIKDLGTISYQFVAANSMGQALHSVTVQLDSVSAVGGAPQNVLSMAGYLVTLLIAAVAAAVMM